MCAALMRGMEREGLWEKNWGVDLMALCNGLIGTCIIKDGGNHKDECPRLRSIDE